MKLSQLQTQILWMFIILGIGYTAPLLLFGDTGVYPQWIVWVTVIYFFRSLLYAFRDFPGSHKAWPNEPSWKRLIRVLL